MTTVSLSVPNFVTGTVALILFGVVLAVLPAGGVPRAAASSHAHLFPPRRDHAGMERLLCHHGTRPRDPATRHSPVLDRTNALPPAVTVLGLQIGHLLGGAVIVETLFAWPGLGYLTEQAINRHDYPVVQVLLRFSVAIFIVVQVSTDLVHRRLDPHIRTGA